MKDILKSFKDRLAFELRSEKHLVSSELKNCECGIYVDNHCVICGKKKEAPKQNFDISFLN